MSRRTLSKLCAFCQRPALTTDGHPLCAVGERTEDALAVPVCEGCITALRGMANLFGSDVLHWAGMIELPSLRFVCPTCAALGWECEKCAGIDQFPTPCKDCRESDPLCGVHLAEAEAALAEVDRMLREAAPKRRRAPERPKPEQDDWE